MADDSSMKMETLKKAYAEIILNTSKEAAAKIMVADRRAMCYQKDLNAVKEDALRMLVQLKQMLDFKVAEADSKSENQQRKIDELEAQLSEAEGIIVDLREELRMTQDKLEEVKYNQRRPVKQQTSEAFEDQQLNNRSTAKADDRRYATDKYPSTDNMTLEYACRDQAVTSLPTEHFQPSILSRRFKYRSFENAHSKKQLTEMALQHPSVYEDANPVSKEHCSSSSSSEPDEQDSKLVSNESEAKSQEFEAQNAQSIRDGSRRNRKNLKYQEAIAALRKSSHGKNKPSVQLPCLSRCRTKAVKQNKSSVELSDKNGTYRMDHNHDTAQEYSREMEGNSAQKESNGNLRDTHISDDEETAGVTNRADCDKVIKFTFQRKRKREVLEKADAAKLQNSVVKDEQTKDGTQLLQIAHQLISLSGNGHS